MASAESLLTDLSGADPRITAMIAKTGPLLVPFDTLTNVDGWLVDTTSDQSAGPFDDPVLEAEQRVVNALLVACDYAIRRGAGSIDDAIAVLRRESPVAVIADPAVNPIIQRIIDQMGIGSAFPDAFGRRRRGHEFSAGLSSDPALSFKARSIDQDVGGNALSSLLVRPTGDGDQATASGEIGERWAVEIGLPACTPVDVVRLIQREVAGMPSFLSGVTSYASDGGIVVGWPNGHAPEPHDIAVVIQAWTKGLFDLPSAEVRVVFAPAIGESHELTEMRARADALRMYRDESNPGDTDEVSPESTMNLPGG